MLKINDERFDLFVNEVIDFIFSDKMKERAKQMHQFGDNLILKIANPHDIILMKCATERIKDKDIDVLVNNAGFSTLRYFHKEPIQLQEDMVAVHILCTMKLIYAILPSMIKKRHGIIINVSSAGAFMSTPNEATYVGTKAFQRAFSEALYFELIGTGVKIQAVCPGLTKTDMPIRLGIPEDQLIDRGPFKWISPKDVVEASLRDLKKNKVICFPEKLTGFQLFFRYLLPSSVYYKVMYYYFKKYGWIEETQAENHNS